MRLYFLDLNPRKSARLVMDKHISRALMDAVQLLSITMVRADHWVPYHPKDNTWQTDPNEFKRVHSNRRISSGKSTIKGVLLYIKQRCLYSIRNKPAPPPHSYYGKVYSKTIGFYISWLEDCGTMDNINWLYSYADELGSEYSRRWGLSKSNPDKIFHTAHQALFEMKNSEYDDFWNCKGSMKAFEDKYRCREYNHKDQTTWPLKIFPLKPFPENYYSHLGASHPLVMDVYWDAFNIMVGNRLTHNTRTKKVIEDPVPPCNIYRGLSSSYRATIQRMLVGEYKTFREILSASYNRRMIPPYIAPSDWGHSLLHNVGNDLVRAVAANRIRYLCVNGNPTDLSKAWTRDLQLSHPDHNPTWVKPLAGPATAPPRSMAATIRDIKKEAPWWISRSYGEAQRHFRTIMKFKGSRKDSCWCKDCAK